jgi:hypothetical protein
VCDFLVADTQSSLDQLIDFEQTSKGVRRRFATSTACFSQRAKRRQKRFLVGVGEIGSKQLGQRMSSATDHVSSWIDQAEAF